MINYKYLKHRIIKRSHRLRNIFIRKLYRDNDRDIHKSVLIAGSARSGTTWLANVVASQFPCRIMFEPFNPQLVKEFNHFPNFLYMRPEKSSPELRDFGEQLFSGAIRDAWIDRQASHLFPKYRVIKDVRATLMLKWLDNQFPEVPKLFIIRHPCAVVLSRMTLGWNPDNDIQDFLNQPELVEDFLGKYTDLIRMSDTEEEKNAIIWCITNTVPIKQFEDGGLNIVLYEELVKNPEVEIPKIFSVIHMPYEQNVFKVLGQPSMTSLPSSSIMSRDNRLDRWKDELSSRQIRDIYKIVERMGLNHIVAAIESAGR